MSTQRIMPIFFMLLSFNVTAGESYPLQITQCLPTQYHWIMSKIVKHESSYSPYALHVNGFLLKKQPENKAEAIRWAKKLTKAGRSVDIGAAQVNNQHLKNGGKFERMGYKLEDAFETCINIRMGALIYAENYLKTGNVEAALSMYNTGSATRGISNGYVKKVLASK